MSNKNKTLIFIMMFSIIVIVITFVYEVIRLNFGVVKNNIIENDDVSDKVESNEENNSNFIDDYIFNKTQVEKTLEKQRKDTYASNVHKFVAAVKNDIAADIKRVAVGEYNIVLFKDIPLDKVSNIKSSFGNYVINQSYVIVVNNDGNYEYYAAALDDNGYGFAITKIDESFKDTNIVSNPTVSAITALSSTGQSIGGGTYKQASTLWSGAD